jgi:hypothetical protein
LESLAAMGPPAEAAIPALKEILSGEDGPPAREAARTIQKVRKQ